MVAGFPSEVYRLSGFFASHSSQAMEQYCLQSSSLIFSLSRILGIWSGSKELAYGESAGFQPARNIPWKFHRVGVVPCCAHARCAWEIDPNGKANVVVGLPVASRIIFSSVP